MTSPIKLEHKSFIPSLPLQSLPVVKSVSKPSTTSNVNIPTFIPTPLSEHSPSNSIALPSSSKEKIQISSNELPIRVLMHDTRSGKPTKAAEMRMERAKQEREAKKKRESTKRKRISDEESQDRTDESAQSYSKRRSVASENEKETENNEIRDDRKSQSQSQTKSEFKNEEETTTVSVFAPRLQVVNGKLVVSEESLTVQTAQTLPTTLDPTTRPVSRIIEDETRHITSHSYLPHRTPSEKWTNAETNLFYYALRQCGTDFTLIEKFFPHRNRRQIRNKFKKEERDHPERIDFALKHPLPLDIEHFRKLLTHGKSKSQTQSTTENMNSTSQKELNNNNNNA